MPFIADLPPSTDTLPSLWEEAQKSIPRKLTWQVSIILRTPWVAHWEIYRYNDKEEILDSLFRLYNYQTGESLQKDIIEKIEKLYQIYNTTYPTGDTLGFLWFLELQNIRELTPVIRRIQSLLSKNPETYLRENSPRIEREFWRIGAFFTNIGDGLDSENFLALLALLGNQDSASSQDRIASIIWLLPPELLSQWEHMSRDPREMRRISQIILGRAVEIVRGRFGVDIGFVSLGWVDRWDGGWIVHIPGKDGKSPNYLVIMKDSLVHAKSLSEALDMTENPVFTHYLIDAYGQIQGVIRTPRSLWTREQLFPDENILTSWLANPSLIPSWSSLEVEIRNTGERVIITHKTEKGIFARIGAWNDAFHNLQVSSSHVTIGWEYRKNENSLILHATGSVVRGEKIKRQEWIQIGAEWKNTLYKNESWKIALGENILVSAQATEGNWRQPQIGEIISRSMFQIGYILSEKTTFTLEGWNKYTWAPEDVTPNTFYKLKIGERGITNFLATPSATIGIDHRTHDGAYLSMNIGAELEKYTRSIKTSVRYLIADTEYSLRYKNTKSTNPHIPGENTLWGSISKNIGTTRLGAYIEKSNFYPGKWIVGWINISFPLGK